MLVLVIGFSMIRSLKVLAPFSLVANVLSIGGRKINIKEILERINYYS
jgi:hypothetical protein